MDIFEEAEEALTRVKIQIMTRSVFYTVIMLGLKHKFTKSIPTAAVDGFTVFYNPNFFLKCNPEEKVGLAMHEFGHVALQHIGRRGDREPGKYNCAGDYSINNSLVDQGYELPDGALINSDFIGDSTEKIYGMLPDNPDSGGMGGDILAPPKGKTAQDAATNAKELTIKAAIQQKMADPTVELDSEIQRTLKELLKPRLNWKIILSQYMQDNTKENNSWIRPNRRYMPELYLPSQFSPTIKHMVVAIDSSGSVTQDEIVEYLTEIQNLRNTFTLERLTIISCDYKIRQIVKVKPGEDLTKLKLTGGSYTRFGPVFKYLKKEKPTVLLYFTDMQSNFNFDRPTFDTIWLNVWDDEKAPKGYGRTILIKRR